RLPGGPGAQRGGRFAVRRGRRGPGAEASGEVLVPAGAGGRGEDGDVADAVLGGPQDQLEPYRPVVGQAQRAQEGDVGQFGAAAGIERGGGLQDGFQEGGGGQPDLTADPVVGQVGEPAVAQVDLGLEQVPSGLVGGLDVGAEQGRGAGCGGRGGGEPVAGPGEGVGRQDGGPAGREQDRRVGGVSARVQVTGPAQQHVPAVLLAPQRPDGGHGDAGVGGHRFDGAGERGVRAEFDEVAVAVVEQAADGVGEPDGPAQVVEPVGGVEAFA